MLIRLLCGAMLLLGTTVACNPDTLTIRQVDPLINVLPQVADLPTGNDTLRVARGENASLQLVISTADSVSDLSASLRSLRSLSGSTLTRATPGWVQTVTASHAYTPGAPDALQSPTGRYPDPILTDTTVCIAAGGSAVLWLDIEIPTEAEATIYKGVVALTGSRNGRKFTAKQPFTLQVYPVTLPQQSLLVTNWFFPEKFAYMNGGEEVADNSPLYWECLEQLLSTASAYGQNVWLLYETGTPIPTPDGRSFAYDFTRMDQNIEFLLRHAHVERIEANHFAKRSHNGWTDPFWANVPVLDGKGGYAYERLPHDDPRVRLYTSTYFAALQQHLQSRPLNDGTGRTWLDIYTQHVADEPLDENKTSWEGLARQVKQAAPQIRIIEAYRSSSYDPALIDILVPQLDEFAGDNYRQIPAGHSCWFYTCMYPRGNFANRYVTLPLLKTRLLHWINFRYNSPGYLHWGFNFWGENGDPFGDVSAPGNDWPGGDSHIVYPGYHKLYPSIRLAAMRDGIRDYDLLRLVEAQDPARAQAFAAALVLDFDRYDTSVAHFRRIRREMLDFLAADNAAK